MRIFKDYLRFYSAFNLFHSSSKKNNVKFYLLKLKSMISTINISKKLKSVSEPENSFKYTIINMIEFKLSPKKYLGFLDISLITK